jgi:hypothetical protein
MWVLEKQLIIFDYNKVVATKITYDLKIFRNNNMTIIRVKLIVRCSLEQPP